MFVRRLSECCLGHFQGVENIFLHVGFKGGIRHTRDYEAEKIEVYVAVGGVLVGCEEGAKYFDVVGEVCGLSVGMSESDQGDSGVYCIPVTLQDLV